MFGWHCPSKAPNRCPLRMDRSIDLINNLVQCVTTAAACYPQDASLTTKQLSFSQIMCILSKYIRAKHLFWPLSSLVNPGSCSSAFILFLSMKKFCSLCSLFRRKQSFVWEELVEEIECVNARDAHSHSFLECPLTTF